MPAAIDFILARTEQEKLICAGHSQGGSVLTVLLSDRPEYNEKVSSVHLMAPAIFLRFYNFLLHPAVTNLYQIKVCKHFKNSEFKFISIDSNQSIFIFIRRGLNGENITKCSPTKIQRKIIN